MFEPEAMLQCRVLRLCLLGSFVDEGGSGGCTFCSRERSWAGEQSALQKHHRG